MEPKASLPGKLHTQPQVLLCFGIFISTLHSGILAYCPGHPSLMLSPNLRTQSLVLFVLKVDAVSLAFHNYPANLEDKVVEVLEDSRAH